MKLTVKDKEFLERVRELMQNKELSVDLKTDGYKRMVLRGNYGDKIDRSFNMTRQGVRWRFNRLANECYVSAYESIFQMESLFGTELRQMALDIAKERVMMRKEARKTGNFSRCRREEPLK